MNKIRLDQLVVQKGLVATRSQAESWIRLGRVMVGGTVNNRPDYFVPVDSRIELRAEQQYVSRAGLKLASVAEKLGLSFAGKVVLDVGSSTGGFTDYALRHGAHKVIAVDAGTNQLHSSLRHDMRIELREQTDIRDVPKLPEQPDIVVIDVSFVSLRGILPHIATLVRPDTHIVAMLKPQFEAASHAKHHGIIKNDAMRRDIMRDFEQWAKRSFVVIAKADSDVAGSKGNRERFYMLRLAASS